MRKEEKKKSDNRSGLKARTTVWLTVEAKDWLEKRKREKGIGLNFTIERLIREEIKREEGAKKCSN